MTIKCTMESKQSLIEALEGSCGEKAQLLGYATQGSLSRWKRSPRASNVEAFLLRCFQSLNEEDRRAFVRGGYKC